MNTKLLVTIDTEENWEGPGSNAKPDVSNIYNIPSLQEDCFDRFGIKPVYMVDYPVASDQKCVEILKKIYESGGCEIGAHLHHWNVPPFTEKEVLEKSFQYKLPRDIEKQKISDLTEKIQREFGVKPVTFRAGRWGADGETIDILNELGYKIDVSVTPLINYEDEGGANFYYAPFDIYLPSLDDIVVPSVGDNDIVMEIPVTVGFSHRDFERARGFYENIQRYPRNLHLTGILSRVNALKKIKLSPEQADFKDMKQLVDSCLKRNSEVLHLTFHSSVYSVGASPYSRTKKEMDMRKNALLGILEYISKVKKIENLTASEIYEKRRK